jgi:predicted Fe-Mo cluster-binding NifX family protein
MRIAIPHWRDRVSPMFDESRRLLLVDIKNGREVSRVEEVLVLDNPLLRVKQVKKTKADILVCGAISQALKHNLQAAGIVVMGFTCGPVNDIIEAILERTLMNPKFAMPGCIERRNRDFKQDHTIELMQKHKGGK